MQLGMNSRGRAVLCVVSCLAVVASVAMAGSTGKAQSSNVWTSNVKADGVTVTSPARSKAPVLEVRKGLPEGPGVCDDGVLDAGEDCDPSAPPPNNVCADGSACDPLTCLCGTCDNCPPPIPVCEIFEGVPYAGTTVGNSASNEGETGACLDNSLIIDAFVEYNPTCTGVATMTSTCTSGNACLNMVHGFIPPDGCNALIACDDTGTALSWNVFAGDRFFLRVGDVTGVESGYSVTVTCAPSVCGNGVKEPGEDCDGAAMPPDDVCADGTACPADCQCAGCPASVITGGCNGTISQSTSTDVAATAISISCGGGQPGNNWARCFNDLDEGLTGDFQVDSVTFEPGLAVDGSEVCVKVYSTADCGAGPSLATSTLLCTECGIINLADEDTLVTYTFANAPIIGAGNDVVIEVNTSTGTFIAEQNNLPECDLTYIRADACGLTDWAALGGIGFPDSHLNLTAAVSCSGAPAVCGNGVQEGCEDCDGDNIPCGGGTSFCTASCACVNPPPNDNCVDAAPLGDCGGPFTTLASTTDGPDHSALGNPCAAVNQTVNNDVWYSYTATCTGDLVVSTCDDADYNSKLAVYDATAGCPVGDGDLLGCNDTAAGCTGGTAETTVSVTVGQPLLIRVGGGLAGETGTGNISITCGLTNDSCSTPKTALDGSNPYCTCGATTDGPPVTDPNAGKNDVWFDYVATATGDTLFSLCSSTNSYDSTLQVYDTSACTGAELATGDDDCGVPGGLSEVTVATVMGQTYKVRVSSWDNSPAMDQIFGCGDLVITPPQPIIPTVSEWGMIVMGMLLFTIATIVIRRRGVATSAA